MLEMKFPQSEKYNVAQYVTNNDTSSKPFYRYKTNL